MEALLNDPLTWAAIGLILVIAETISGEGSLLGFGLSGFILGFLIWLFGIDLSPLWLFTIFVAVGVLASILTRRFLAKTEKYKGDINTY